MTELSESEPTPVHVETGIGTLSLFPQRFQDIGAFSKLPVDEPSPTRLRMYLPYMASLANPTNGAGEQSRIDEASALQLSSEDLERIAEAYLSMPEMRQIAQDPKPSSSPIVRAEGESATGYLDRLLREDHERQMGDLRATYQTLEDKSVRPIASALEDVDRQASSLREVATNFMQGHGPVAEEGRSERGPDALATSLEDNRMPSRDAEPTESDRLKRAHDEEIMLTRSIGVVTTQSAILVASLSEAATQFLRQFSETTQNSDRATRTSLRTVLVLVSIMSLVSLVAAAAAILGYVESRENRQATSLWRESIEQSMKDTAATQGAQLNSLDSQMRALSDHQRTLSSPPASAALTVESAGPRATGGEALVAPAPKTGPIKRGSKRKTGH